MSKQKESKQERKDRIAKQNVQIHDWARVVRKQITLPANLKGTLVAMVDASSKGKLTVHVYQVGEMAGKLIMQKQNDILPDLKFWMVASPNDEKDVDAEPPRFKLLLSRKQHVTVYSGNHYISATVPIDRSAQLSKDEKLKLFAK